MNDRIKSRWASLAAFALLCATPAEAQPSSLQARVEAKLAAVGADIERLPA